MSNPADASAVQRVSSLGWLARGESRLIRDEAEIKEALDHLSRGYLAVRAEDGSIALAEGAEFIAPSRVDGRADLLPVLGFIPPCSPEQLGDSGFCADHGLKYPYVAGAMANGVGSAEIVEAMGRAGMLGVFGAAGLSMARVESAIDRIQKSLGAGEGAKPYGFNLIHSPAEPAMEAGCVDLYIRRGIRLIEASAYLNLTLPLVRYRVHGIHRAANGEVVAPNRVIAKVSRIEVARRFFSPPPEKFLKQLVESKDITPEQAGLAKFIPVAQDLTGEADSGGHTDNQPFVTLLPTLLALRDELQEEFKYARPLRVGAGGGIGTPAAATGAFAMGAAYILTGSINQSCVESGTSDLVRQMLCATRQADVAMAPAADMFEMGVRVQVLKRGTMFAMRAAKLYEFYRAYGSLDEIPPAQCAMLEKDYFRIPLDEVWRQTREFFEGRDPSQIVKAEKDPKYKMALVFRWYLGQSSGWAQAGDPSRQVDFQIWCGPAMGAFNEWVKGSFIEKPEERKVVTVALNLLHGAAVLTRIHQLRAQGVILPQPVTRIEPKRSDALTRLLDR
ncbi:PfaD family polyunsaturated fatty acid/polyketide biosynthesis protein [Candidatus Sumerlaeota bacterium]|nr:PfaD family polyunsaturated fatty acid/polyketide biosynthesis protein [Candidatus Sumerlaeota bacterium]